MRMILVITDEFVVKQIHLLKQKVVAPSITVNDATELVLMDGQDVIDPLAPGCGKVFHL